jgi:hypothetical protein
VFQSDLLDPAERKYDKPDDPTQASRIHERHAAIVTKDGAQGYNPVS